MKDTLRYEVPFFQVPDELIKDGRTNVYHIALFSAIAMHANKERFAWPSQSRLAKLTGASRNKVKQALVELEQLGWLTIERRWDKTTQRYESTIYRLASSLQGRSQDDQPLGHQMTNPWSPDDQEPDPLNQTNIEPENTPVASPTPMKHPIDKTIDELFLESGDYPNFGKERQMVKKIRQLVIRDNPEDPQGKAVAMVRAFQWMIERGGDRFWREQPFLPSRLVRYWRDIEQKMRVEVHKRKQPFAVDPKTGVVYETEEDWNNRQRR